MTSGDDESTGSLTDRIRRAVAGPTDEERADRLEERAEQSPAALDRDDIAELRDLLGHDDEELVGTAVGAVLELATEQPSLAAELTPHLVAVLTNRSAETWRSTTLGEADRGFMNDLLAGSALFELANADPEYLIPVVEDLEALMLETDGRLEPHALFAFASVAAADVNVDITVPPERFVDPISRTLRASVEDESEDGDFGGGLSITVATWETQVELLEAFGHERALDALQYATENTDNEDLSVAAAEAIQSIEG
jgi:hypothetical protein